MRETKIITCLLISGILGISTMPTAKAEDAPPPLTKAQIIAVSYGNDIDLYKMAYVAAARKSAEQYAEQNIDTTNDPAGRERYISWKEREARDLVNGASFRNGWIEAIAKESVPIVGSATLGPEFLLVPKPLTDKAVETILDQFARPSLTPEMDSQAVVDFAAYMIAAANDKSSPDYEVAQSLTKDYLNLDPAISYDLLPAVRAHANSEALNKRLDELEKILTDKSLSLDQMKEALREEMQGQTQELIGAMQSAFADAQAISDKDKTRFTPAQIEDYKRAVEYKKKFQEISGAFGAFSGLATLTGDAEAAAFFNKAGALSEGISEAIQISLTESFAESPMMYAHAYVGVAVLAMNLLNSSSGEDKRMQQLMEQIQKIAEQVEDLRQQMHQRLDVLDYKVARGFEVVTIDVRNLNRGVAITRRQFSDINRDLREMQNLILSGLSFEWRVQTTTQETLCWGTNSRGQTIAISEKDFLICRNFFALSAYAPQSLTVGVNGVEINGLADLGKISLQELEVLRNTVKDLDPSNEAVLNWGVLPQSWIYGAKSFLQLFKSHPNMVELANHTGIMDRDDLSLDRMIADGRRIIGGISELLLSKNETGYSLKRDLLENILELYRVEAEEALDLGYQLQREATANGPNTSIGSDAPAIMDNNYAFFTAPEARVIDFCEGAPRDVNVGTFDLTKNKWGWALNAAEPWKKEYLQGFSKEWFAWDPSFLPLIPNAVLWASRTNFANTRVIPCFRSVEIPSYVFNKAGLEYQVRITIEFQVHSTITGAESFVVGRSVLDTGLQTLPGVKIVAKPGSPQIFLNSFWNAPASDWEPVWRNTNQSFVKIEANESNPAFEIFKNAFDAEISKNRADKSVELETILSNRFQVSKYRTLTLIASLGMDSDNAKAREFLTWLSDEDALPSPIGLARVAFGTAMTTTQLKELIQPRIELGKQMIASLSSARGLRPRTSEVEDLVGQLDRLNQQETGFLQNWWNNIFGR